MVILVILVHPSKAYCLMSITEFGIVILVNDVQFFKAWSPISETESDIITFFTLELP